MQRVFKEVNSLDKRCYDKFALSEDILMENASGAIAKFIKSRFSDKKSILIVAGSGNNGADGIALARILHRDFEVKLFLALKAKSKMARLQLKRAKLVGVKVVDKISPSDITIDCIFGSGLSRAVSKDVVDILKYINLLDSIKIACDIPTGIDIRGDVKSIAFEADYTVTMGALKKLLFSDIAKNYVGEIILADLGIAREVYEIESDTFLLDKNDLELPFREKSNTHKGSFGHLAILSGEKIGASTISSLASLNFGSGLTTLISKRELNIPFEIMQSKTLPKTTSALALGMGLGNSFLDSELRAFLDLDLPTILDADIFYNPLILEFLDSKDNLVLTPHPKEFVALLNLINIKTTTNELQSDRFFYVEEFTKRYPNVVLLLKGANTVIAYHGKVFINPFGSNALSKGGSGDILSGMIGSLLAQRQNSLKATINASIAHSLLPEFIDKNNYSITPTDLIEAIGRLK